MTGAAGGAAFFDLDRTLLPRASGPIFSRHLQEHGVGVGGIAELAKPVTDLFTWVYNEFGESWINMQVAKRLVRASAGWPVLAVCDAAEAAAEEIAREIPEFAHQLLEQHRKAGDQLIIATTSPTVFVRPLAEHLGFDDIIGSVWGHDGEQFTGRIEGEFVWGPKKRDAVVQWATARDIPLDRCSAYSDSYFDGSMLDAVGNPVAVNPDVRLAGVAALKGWKIRWFDTPDGVVKLARREVQEWIRPFQDSGVLAFANHEFSGLENIPADGPTILAFNHRSYFDAATMALLVSRTGRTCRFLGKKEMFDTPLVGPALRALGGIRVDRGSGNTDSLDEAILAVGAGEMVALAPQGTIPRGPDFFDPKLQGRNGAARLAAATGAPVIPVGLWGTEHVWPRSHSRPILDPTNRPRVSVQVGPPVTVKGTSPTRDTTAIMKAITAQLPPEARKKRTPTEDELARTYPSGRAPTGDSDS